jgi:cold shock CspA family protein
LEATLAKGTVKWFNATKGYGFIQPMGGGKDVFVHISAVERAGLSTLNDSDCRIRGSREQRKDLGGESKSCTVIARDGLQPPQNGRSAPAGRREGSGQPPRDRCIGAWDERQAKRMPMLFSPTIGAAITAGYWFLWVRCPACRMTNAIDLRTLDRHPDAAVTSLIPALSCRSCRPNAPFAELARLSRTSIADEMRIEHTRRVLGEGSTDEGGGKRR